MSASEALLPLKGSRLPGIPKSWFPGLASHPGAVELLALAEGLATFLPGGQAHPQYERTVLLLLFLLLAQAEGHSGLPLDPAEGKPLARWCAAFGADPAVLAAQATPDRLAPLLGGPGAPLVLEHGVLYAQRLHQGEVRLAEAIAARCQPSSDLGPEPAPEVLTLPRPLNGLQALAVRQALSSRLTLVTGGPGTGKTSIIVAILREAVRRGTPIGRVALAAPTGKAANRMFTSILENLAELAQHQVPAPWQEGELSPATLHRLLGYQPGPNRYRHHRTQPLPADLVIVDEASMVDLLMMERLFQAVPPGARLVFLGDAQQLPSVEAGCVFQDLVNHLGHAVVRLTRNYRMGTKEGQPLFTAALKLAEGQEAQALFQDPHPILPWQPGFDAPRVDQFDGKPQELKAFLLDHFHNEVEFVQDRATFLDRIHHVHVEHQGEWRADDAQRLKHLFDLQKKSRILCPMREGAGLRCTEGINDLLHHAASRHRDRNLDHALALTLGEPVMMTRNDYRRWLFNGDQGLILMVARDGGPPRLEAVFPSPEGGFSAHAVGPILAHLELAYALTVHKAQGSEYERVVIVLPSEDTPFVSREILYTALTRAKRVVTIVGSREVILQAADRTLARTSGLPGRLLEGPND